MHEILNGRTYDFYLSTPFFLEVLSTYYLLN